MFDAQQLLGQLLGGSMAGALGGKGGSGRRSRSLLGSMSGGTKAQLGVGLLGIAFAAYDHYSRQSPAARPDAVGAGKLADLPPPPPLQVPPPPPGAAAAHAPSEQQTRDTLLLIQAMVAAAAADGHIDDEERGRIMQRAADAGLDEDARRFLQAELAAPKSLLTIVAASRPEIAQDIYAASCVAINPDSDAERSYLDTLGKRLNLTAQARESIHQQVGID